MSEKITKSPENIELPKASDDFFRHVNGEWLAEPMPAGEVRWGTYDIIGGRTLERLHDISDKLLLNTDAPKGSPEQQVRDFYLSGVDMEQRNKLGKKPLESLYSYINDTHERDKLPRLLADMRRHGVSPFFSLYFDEDDKQSGANALYIEQGGLNLPSRDYYIKDDEKSLYIQAQYHDYKVKMFSLLGYSSAEAEKASLGVKNIENQIALKSLPSEEIREADKNYHKYTLNEADNEFPDLDFTEYFDFLGKPDIKELVVRQPSYIKAVQEVLQTADVEDIKRYLEFTMFNRFAGSLSQEFIEASFDFNGRVLNGQTEQRPLWKKIVQTYSVLPIKDAVGPLYCQEYFDKSTKVKLAEMYNDVREAFVDQVNSLDWMTGETKHKTVQKLNNIRFKMGYPDEWNDISELDLRDNSFVENLMVMSEYKLTKGLDGLDKPFDEDEWAMPPIMVNACSDLKREATFPAAVLQDPFFDPSQDDAYNYGAIGCTMGHELTHFFDDQGCKYDLDGNLKAWWGDDDKANFDKLADEFDRYFSSLQIDGMNINGRLTLGENIADVGGIKIAYYAYQKRLKRDNKREIIDGLTPEQRFFVGWSRKWATKMTPEATKRQILTDPHSPGEIRVNGVLSITPEFQDAFNVVEGDGMYIAKDEMPELW